MIYMIFSNRLFSVKFGNITRSAEIATIHIQTRLNEMSVQQRSPTDESGSQIILLTICNCYILFIRKQKEYSEKFSYL